MRLPCPHCGERFSDEFVPLGGMAPARPGLEASEADWVAHVYARDNPAGVHREHWQHLHGCRAWLIVTRDTVSHAILSVEPARPAAAGAAP